MLALVCNMTLAFKMVVEIVACLPFNLIIVVVFVSNPNVSINLLIYQSCYTNNRFQSSVLFFYNVVFC